MLRCFCTRSIFSVLLQVILIFFILRPTARMYGTMSIFNCLTRKHIHNLSANRKTQSLDAIFHPVQIRKKPIATWLAIPAPHRHREKGKKQLAKKSYFPSETATVASFSSFFGATLIKTLMTPVGGRRDQSWGSYNQKVTAYFFPENKLFFWTPSSQLLISFRLGTWAFPLSFHAKLEIKSFFKKIRLGL